MTMFDVTVTVDLTFQGVAPEALEALGDVVMDALCERTDNGAVSVDLGKSLMEIEVIAARQGDVDLGVAIARRIILDSMEAAGIRPDDAVETVEHKDVTLLPA